MAEPPTPLLALKALDIGALLNDDELAGLVSMSVTNIYDAGSVILDEGVVAPSVDIIASGVVETSITTPQGATKPIDQLVPGEYFGIALDDDGRPVVPEIHSPDGRNLDPHRHGLSEIGSRQEEGSLRSLCESRRATDRASQPSPP